MRSRLATRTKLGLSERRMNPSTSDCTIPSVTFSSLTMRSTLSSEPSDSFTSIATPKASAAPRRSLPS
jgi:hypothetical protein